MFCSSITHPPFHTSQPQPPAQPARRIDGPGLRRESPLGGGDGSWLSESQVDFFTGGGPGEASPAASADPAAAATVRRRLIIGGLATAATAGFALVPTDALRLSRPAAPLFMYLTPLVAALPLLAAAADAAAGARWTELADIHARLESAPLDVPGNLRAVAAHADTAPVRAAVAALARDGIEYVAQIDFNDYYENRGEFRGGAREQQFADFSATAAREAVKTIEKVLALAPADAGEAARARAAAGAG